MDITERFGERFRDHHPAVVAFWLILAGFLVTAAVLILVGLFITHGPFAGPIGRWDAHVSQWFVDLRTETWNRVTVIGSGLGMTEVIVGIELLALLVLAVIRRWRDAAFLFCAVTLEAAVAFSTSIMWTLGAFDTFKVGDRTLDGSSIVAGSTRVHFGVVWFPRG